MCRIGTARADPSHASAPARRHPSPPQREPHAPTSQGFRGLWGRSEGAVPTQTADTGTGLDGARCIWRGSGADSPGGHRSRRQSGPELSSHLEDHRSLRVWARVSYRIVLLRPTEARPVVEGVYLGQEGSQRAETDRSLHAHARPAVALEHDLLSGLVRSATVGFLHSDDDPRHRGLLLLAARPHHWSLLWLSARAVSHCDGLSMLPCQSRRRLRSIGSACGFTNLPAEPGT